MAPSMSSAHVSQPSRAIDVGLGYAVADTRTLNSGSDPQRREPFIETGSRREPPTVTIIELRRPLSAARDETSGEVKTKSHLRRALSGRLAAGHEIRLSGMCRSATYGISPAVCRGLASADPTNRQQKGFTVSTVWG